MKKTVRLAMVGTLAMSGLFLSALPATAASNPASSCVGTVVSTLAPNGTFNVQDFKGLATSEGVPFGAFVAGGAQVHLGSYASCLG